MHAPNVHTSLATKLAISSNLSHKHDRAEPGYEYMGCFIDQEQRDMEFEVPLLGDAAATVERCEQKCAGYEYFSLQHYNQCYCDRSPPQGDSVGDEQCDTMCSGNPYEACGGSWRNSVYRRNRESNQAY